MAEKKYDPRSREDLEMMWDKALNDLTITSTAARIRGATLEIHEILEGAGF